MKDAKEVNDDLKAQRAEKERLKNIISSILDLCENKSFPIGVSRAELDEATTIIKLTTLAEKIKKTFDDEIERQLKNVGQSSFAQERARTSIENHFKKEYPLDELEKAYTALKR